ncbi:MAG: hypothetical protein Kow00108_08470 [Calditrichia bacterium]
MKTVRFLVVTPDKILRDEILTVLTPPFHWVQFAENVQYVQEHPELLDEMNYVIIDELGGWLAADFIARYPKTNFIYLDGLARHFSMNTPNFRTISKLNLLATLNNFRYGLFEKHVTV